MDVNRPRPQADVLGSVATMIFTFPQGRGTERVGLSALIPLHYCNSLENLRFVVQWKPPKTSKVL